MQAYIVQAFECEQNISFDKEYLENLAGGKFKAQQVYVLLTPEQKIYLKSVATNEFDFSYYDKLLNDGMEDKATDYFNQYHRCIYKDTIQSFSTYSDLLNYAEDEFIDGYRIENNILICYQ